MNAKPATKMLLPLRVALPFGEDDGEYMASDEAVSKSECDELRLEVNR